MCIHNNGNEIRSAANIILSDDSALQNSESNSSDRNCTTPALFQFNPVPNTICIPIEKYRQLCQATIDLIKANKTIEKLNKIMEKNSTSQLSPVS